MGKPHTVSLVCRVDSIPLVVQVCTCGVNEGLVYSIAGRVNTESGAGWLSIVSWGALAEPVRVRLRLERGALQFEPGQYVTLGVAGSMARREYSIYSGCGDPHLEVLIKQVEGGSVSHQLARLPAGAALECDGPFGYFTIPPARRAERCCLNASALPRHPRPSAACSAAVPSMNDRLLHLRPGTEPKRYDGAQYPADRYLGCLRPGGPRGPPPGQLTRPG